MKTNILKNSKLQKLITLPFLILIPALWIVGQNFLNPISLIFGTFAIFILICLFLNTISLFLGRNNKIVSGTCLSSDFNRILDNRGVIISEYYQNVFEYFDEGIRKTTSFQSDQQFRIGCVKKLNIGKDVTVLQKDYDEAKSKKNIMGMVYFVLVSILGIGVSEYVGKIIASSGFDSYNLLIILPIIVGIVFPIVGFSNFKSAISDKQKIKDAIPVEAKILGYVENWSTDSEGTSHVTYMPLYEYTYRGKVKTYQSNIGSSSRKQVGDIEEIYILNGRVIEKRGIKIKLSIGIIFFILGLAVLVFAGCFLFKQLLTQ